MIMNSVNAPPPYRPASASQHFLELTSLRFIAATMVLLMHYSAYISFPAPLMPVILSGGAGVTFFFTLSGFLLYIRYGEKFERGISTRDFKHYFLSRIARIYPAYLVALLLITFVHILAKYVYAISPTFSFKDLIEWLINLFALQTIFPVISIQQQWNAPSWSVSTEFFFYLIFPFFLSRFVSKLTYRWHIITAIMACVLIWVTLRVGVVLAFHGKPKESLWVDYISDRNFVWRFWEFGVGILFGKLLVHFRPAWLNTRSGRNTAIILMTFILLIIPYSHQPIDPVANTIYRTIRLAILNTVPFAFLMMAVCSGPNILTRPLSWKPMVFMGECSYAIYIYHWPFWMILSYISGAGKPVTATAGWISIGFVIATAMVSFVMIERPIQRWASLTLNRMKNTRISHDQPA